MLARHPGCLAGAVVFCPNFNFWGHGYSRGLCPASEADRAIPVRILTGGRGPLVAIPAAALLVVVGGWLVWR